MVQQSSLEQSARDHHGPKQDKDYEKFIVNEDDIQRLRLVCV